jgi:hypothetical protein
MSVAELIRQSRALLDAGTLTKTDEVFVSATVEKFDKSFPLQPQEISRLRDILDINM